MNSFLIGREVPIFYTGLSIYLQGLTETNIIKTHFGKKPFNTAIYFKYYCLITDFPLVIMLSLGFGVF